MSVTLRRQAVNVGILLERLLPLQTALNICPEYDQLLIIYALQSTNQMTDLYSSTQDFYTLQPPQWQRRSYDGASPANTRRSSLRPSGASFATTFDFSDLPTIPPTPPSKDNAGLKKAMEDKAKSTPRSGLAQPAGSNMGPP
ncbi:hypothetical protein M407DRAFT_21681 [Tulasnella calospora MUT 4182]|uniref:Uncharacterized protein n=1 Tax=Tulasnella calospora MUT 4182 TaxID=1051891 RepID=A0A0C3L5M1_9AGAM|nr:hypothetical protein M407DRAFT_21681 [Tulasnella calospora MUT 4182]